MPCFDFKCDQCGTVIEVIVSNIPVPDPLPLCPDCGEPLRKLPSAPNFVVHGFNAKNGYAK